MGGCAAIDVAPYRLSGTVYCALLNHRSIWEQLGESVHHAPYHAPPQAPVLGIKPRNTLTPSGSTVQIPSGVAELEVAANVGLVIGSTACRVAESRALDYVAGYLILADVSIPHASYHRPAVRFKARDGFCPVGSAVKERSLADPDALMMQTYVDEVLIQSARTADLVRSAARLLADVTEFMTLIPGDVLALGSAAPAPRVRSGQRMSIEVEGLGLQPLQASFLSSVP